MIACNACQLLATNLPVCHRALREASLARFRWLGWELKRPRVDTSCRRWKTYLASLIMTRLGRCLRWRLYRNLQVIRGLDLSVLCWCFIRFEAQKGPHVRFNLVGLAAIMGHLEAIFGLCWVSWCYHAVSWIFEAELLRDFCFLYWSCHPACEI